jgi:hypothetical protein
LGGVICAVKWLRLKSRARDESDTASLKYRHDNRALAASNPNALLAIDTLLPGEGLQERELYFLQLIRSDWGCRCARPMAYNPYYGLYIALTLSVLLLCLVYGLRRKKMRCRRDPEDYDIDEDIGWTTTIRRHTRPELTTSEVTTDDATGQGEPLRKGRPRRSAERLSTAGSS